MREPRSGLLPYLAGLGRDWPELGLGLNSC